MFLALKNVQMAKITPQVPITPIKKFPQQNFPFFPLLGKKAIWKTLSHTKF